LTLFWFYDLLCHPRSSVGHSGEES
jgi:hypothetical protein